jgi:hypothetical protein
VGVPVTVARGVVVDEPVDVDVRDAVGRGVEDEVPEPAVWSSEEQRGVEGEG